MEGLEELGSCERVAVGREMKSSRMRVGMVIGRKAIGGFFVFEKLGSPKAV
jgi:hypothetical protein